MELELSLRPCGVEPELTETDVALLFLDDTARVNLAAILGLRAGLLGGPCYRDCRKPDALGG